MQELQNSLQGYRQRKIGQIPNGWKIIKLYDIVTATQLGTNVTGSSSITGIPLLKMGNLTFGGFSFDKLEYINPKKIQNFKSLSLKDGDFLFNTRNSDILVGKCAVWKNYFPAAIFNNNILRIRFKSEIVYSSDFISYVFNSNEGRKQLQGFVKRTTSVAAIYYKDLKNFQLRIPPIPEQQKIVLFLSKVDELIQKIDQIIEQTQRLKKGLMQRLLIKGLKHTNYHQTEIGRVPIEWKVSTIGNEFKLGTGGTPSRNNLSYFKGNIPWIKTTEIKFNIIESSQEHITQQALEESSAKLYPKGTILMAMYGEGITRGKCAILGIDAAINQACAAIQSLDRQDIKFVFYWLQRQYEKIRSRSHGTHQSNLNLEFVKLLKIPCPPLQEQKKIAQILSNIDNYNEICQHHKTQLMELKKGLMQKLLIGKIRVKV